MNTVLWILQAALALAFAFHGMIKLILPVDLPQQLQYVYDIPSALLLIIGVAEVAGALGLILPGLFKTRTVLTPIASTGLALIMVGAIVFHATRGEYAAIPQNVLLLILSSTVAFARYRLFPLPTRSSQQPV